MTTDLIELGDVITSASVLPDVHFYAAWICPDDRRIVETGRASSATDFMNHLADPPTDDAVLIYWGIAGGRGPDISVGRYLPYPPLDGVAIHAALEPVNQVPHLREFLKHSCTFAHEILTAHSPHAPRLRTIDSWNIAPDITLDVDSINQNRVGMRYYRGVIGYFYDKTTRFGALPGDTSRLSQFEGNWRDELPEMEALDKYVCGECRDESGGSRLRDFIHHCNVAEWDTALDTMEQLSVGVSVQYRGRVPKIDRSDPDNLRPYATRKNVRDWISNNNSVESGWRSMMRDFHEAVKRYDRDPAVRM